MAKAPQTTTKKPPTVLPREPKIRDLREYNAHLSAMAEEARAKFTASDASDRWWVERLTGLSGDHIDDLTIVDYAEMVRVIYGFLAPAMTGVTPSSPSPTSPAGDLPTLTT